MARERLAAARSLELVESKNRALESFAARAAHDLRSPLVPIHGLASLIVRAGRDEADVRLASRIVGLGLADVGGHRRDARLLALGTAAARDAARCGRGHRGAGGPGDSRASGAEVVRPLEEATVDCAPEVLGQILRNVMGNALKYRAPERPCRVEVSTRVEASSVTVEVVDNGRAWSPPPPGERSSPSSAELRRGPGHGLGLAIVDSYVRALGGSVQLRSEAGGRDPGLAPAAQDAPARGARACVAEVTRTPEVLRPRSTKHPRLHPQRDREGWREARRSGVVLPGTERPRGQKRRGATIGARLGIRSPG